MLQRLLISRPKDEESRGILDDLVTELLHVVFAPPWPGALALVRSFSQHLIATAQPDRKLKVTAGDGRESLAREGALRLLGRIQAPVGRRAARRAATLSKRLPRLSIRGDSSSDVGRRSAC